ncbi:MAG: hypothetical protein ACYDAE_29100 [Steroidobacteraceae bacterium]
MTVQPRLIGAHYIALLLLSSCGESLAGRAEIIEANGPGVWLALQELGLIDRSSERTLWDLTERGQVLVEHILELPLPEPVRAWRMPGAPSPSAPAATERVIAKDVLEQWRSLQPVDAESCAQEDGEPPPRPPPPKPIPGIAVAETLAERLKQGAELLGRGYGVTEVAETLELDANELDRFAFPPKGG